MLQPVFLEPADRGVEVGGTRYLIGRGVTGRQDLGPAVAERHRPARAAAGQAGGDQGEPDGPGVGEHPGQAGVGLGRIEGEVGGPGPQGAEDGEDVDAFLRQRGAAAVPFNQIYGPGLPEGEILSPLLDKADLLDVLHQAGLVRADVTHF